MIMGPPGPRGQKGERGESGYVQGHTSSHGDARYASGQREVDLSSLAERLDYSNVAMKVTDYIKSK